MFLYILTPFYIHFLAPLERRPYLPPFISDKQTVGKMYTRERWCPHGLPLPDPIASVHLSGHTQQQRSAYSAQQHWHQHRSQPLPPPTGHTDLAKDKEELTY